MIVHFPTGFNAKRADAITTATDYLEDGSNASEHVVNHFRELRGLLGTGNRPGLGDGLMICIYDTLIKCHVPAANINWKYRIPKYQTTVDLLVYVPRSNPLAASCTTSPRERWVIPDRNAGVLETCFPGAHLWLLFYADHPSESISEDRRKAMAVAEDKQAARLHSGLEVATVLDVDKLETFISSCGGRT